MLLQGPSCNGKRLGKRRKTRAIIPVPTITASLVPHRSLKQARKFFKEQACNCVVIYPILEWKISFLNDFTNKFYQIFNWFCLINCFLVKSLNFLSCHSNEEKFIK